MRITHLLDTNVLSLMMRGRAPALVARLVQLPRERVAMSIITAMELRFGLAKNPTTPHRVAVETVLATIPIDGFPAAMAEIYARVRAGLERRGRPIGALDTIIAAHALARGSTLVTNNLREFGRVTGLSCEDWTDGPAHRP